MIHYIHDNAEKADHLTDIKNYILKAEFNTYLKNINKHLSINLMQSEKWVSDINFLYYLFHEDGIEE